MPGLVNTNLRTQLICLPLYMKDEELARAIAYTWAALSTACHHHIYELAPAASELKAWADTVEAMLNQTWGFAVSLTAYPGNSPRSQDTRFSAETAGDVKTTSSGLTKFRPMLQT